MTRASPLADRGDADPAAVAVTERGSPAADGRIRVLRIIARMNVGGPALQVTGLTRGIDPRRFDHRLLVGHVEPGEADYLTLRAPDLPVQRLPALGRSIKVTGDVRALAAIVAEIRAFRPHIVHTHTAKAGVLGRVAARACRVPYVVHTFHGHLLHGYFGPAATAAVVRVERGLARWTDRLVAVGRKVADDLVAAGVGERGRYVVVPPGVPVPDRPERQEARAALGLPADRPIVAFVGRLTAVKRPDRFVEVARRVLTRRPDALFVVAGEGPLYEETRAAAAPLGDRVRFLGWRADVGTVYAAADLAVLTSDNEGMPVSLIEAALCGRPAVTTDVGSASEVVLDAVTGYVTSLDPGEIVARVVDLLDDDDRRDEFGTAAHRHADANFSSARLVRDMETLYEDLVSGA